MAREATGEKRKRAPQKPRPLHILYTADEAGELNVIAATRDTNEVIEVMDANPGVKRYKYMPPQRTQTAE